MSGHSESDEDGYDSEDYGDVDADLPVDTESFEEVVYRHHWEDFHRQCNEVKAEPLVCGLKIGENCFNPPEFRVLVQYLLFDDAAAQAKAMQDKAFTVGRGSRAITIALFDAREFVTVSEFARRNKMTRRKLQTLVEGVTPQLNFIQKKHEKFYNIKDLQRLVKHLALYSRSK